MTIFWGLPEVCQPPSTFWSVTLQPVGADQATIWQMKGDIPSFHMRHRRLICTKRLQSYGGCINLNNFPLVHNQLRHSHRHRHLLPEEELLARLHQGRQRRQGRGRRGRGRRRDGGQSEKKRQGPNSIDIFGLEFRLEKPLEFWLDNSLHYENVQKWVV